MALDPDEIFAELDRAGEDKVRNLRAKDSHYGPLKNPYVDEWLRRQEEARNEASKREQAALAREANALARDATTSAQTANNIAMAALAVAIASMIIAWFR